MAGICLCFAGAAAISSSACGTMARANACSASALSAAVHLAVDNGEAVTITVAQLGYLLEGIDWRASQYSWRPEPAG